PEKERLVLDEAAVMEDQEPPTVVVVEKVETKKDEHGHDEKIGEGRKLRPILGGRDRRRHVGEVLGLEDPEKKGPENKVSPEGLGKGRARQGEGRKGEAGRAEGRGAQVTGGEPGA